VIEVSGVRNQRPFFRDRKSPELVNPNLERERRCSVDGLAHPQVAGFKQTAAPNGFVLYVEIVRAGDSLQPFCLCGLRKRTPGSAILLNKLDAGALTPSTA
jgi:hypothetical protein